MGLDFIEIVLEAEETFGISIEDDEMTQVTTLGQFSDLISRKISGEIAGLPDGKGFLSSCGGAWLSVLSLPRKECTAYVINHRLFCRIGDEIEHWKRLEQSLALRLPPMDESSGNRTILWSSGNFHARSVSARTALHWRDLICGSWGCTSFVVAWRAIRLYCWHLIPSARSLSTASNDWRVWRRD